MDFDAFIDGINVRKVSLKETIGLYAAYKEKNNKDAGISLVEVINVQTAYIDKLRLELIKEA